MNSDKVSIVIPVYNSERFLKKTIESVLNQTYDNIEIIAIDDGSIDSSLQILRQYSDRIKIISQQNRGLATAVNTAIKNINGRWLKWLSPDDILYPEAVEILVNEAKKLTSGTILYSNWELIDENEKTLRNFSESNYNDLDVFDYNVRLLDGQQININTTLIPCSLFEQGCIMRELDDPVAIDYDFFLRAGILYNTQFHLVQKNLLKYRIHTAQLSHKNIKSTLDYLEKVRCDILSKIGKEQKQRYLSSLLNYKKEKSLTKKTIETGFKIASNILPESIVDKLLVFYVNKVRSSR